MFVNPWFESAFDNHQTNVVWRIWSPHSSFMTKVCVTKFYKILNCSKCDPNRN